MLGRPIDHPSDARTEEPAWLSGPATTPSNQLGNLIDYEVDTESAAVSSAADVRSSLPPILPAAKAFDFFSLPGEVRNQIYKCFIDNRRDPPPSIRIPRFRAYPTLPGPFFTNRRFHMEMGSRLRALAGTERSMVYTGWCTNPKVTVEDALYLTGAGLDTGWAANPFASEIKIYLAPWGRVGILDLVHNVGVVYAAKRFTSGPVGHLRTAEFIVNLDHARLPGHRQSTFLSHRRTLHIWIDDDHTVTVKNPIPGVPLDERSFAWVGKFSLADWVARERRLCLKQRKEHRDMWRDPERKFFW